MAGRRSLQCGRPARDLPLLGNFAENNGRPFPTKFCNWRTRPFLLFGGDQDGMLPVYFLSTSGIRKYQKGGNTITEANNFQETHLSRVVSLEEGGPPGRITPIREVSQGRVTLPRGNQLGQGNSRRMTRSLENRKGRPTKCLEFGLN